MVSKWKKVRMLLGLHACALAPPDLNEPQEPPLPPPPLPMHSYSAPLYTERERERAALYSWALPSSNTEQAKGNKTPSTPKQNSSARNSTQLSRSTCAICLEPMKPGHGHALFTAECSHVFHFGCIASSVRFGNLVCPVCRANWKEVPWLASTSLVGGLKVDRNNRGSRSRRSSSPRAILARRSSSTTLGEEGEQQQRVRLDPLLRILDENIANARDRQWQVPPSAEPSFYNDDEPLGPSTNEGESNSRQIGNDEEVEEGRSSTTTEAIELTTYPELSTVAASEACQSFTVLVHLKAQSAITRSHDLYHGGNDTDSCQLPDPTCRAPLDLVTVLDISGSMAGNKLRLLKQAMAFVIRNLSSDDRLSVISFSSHARRVFPLQRMSELGRQRALLAIDSLVSTGGTNIAEGLQKGAKVLEERRQRNPVASIMLLSDGQDTYSSSSVSTSRRVPFAIPSRGTLSSSTNLPNHHRLVPGSIRRNSRYGHGSRIPVHTFGFGSDHDADTMHTIAEVSGGTFSFIEAQGSVQDAFAQCIGGLLSVVVQNVQLSISCALAHVKINSIQSGSYESVVTDTGFLNHGLVKLGDLYAEEERDVLVDLKLPMQAMQTPTTARGAGDEYMPILHVGCTYKDPVTQAKIGMRSRELGVNRPESVLAGDVLVSLEVDRQRNRLQTAEAIAEARAMAERGELSAAQHTLYTATMALRSSPSALAGDQLCKTLEAEMSEIQSRLTNRYSYETSGRAYLLSAVSSHLRQRATTRGDSVDTHSRDYQTPSMVDMIMRSQTLSFPHPP